MLATRDTHAQKRHYQEIKRFLVGLNVVAPILMSFYWCAVFFAKLLNFLSVVRGSYYLFFNI